MNIQIKKAEAHKGFLAWGQADPVGSNLNHFGGLNNRNSGSVESRRRTEIEVFFYTPDVHSDADSHYKGIRE